jgi:cytidylate kinase
MTAENRPGTGQSSSVSEIARTPEVWKPNFGLIVVSGKPGAGTTSLATRMSEEFGISGNLYKAGDTVRRLQGVIDRAPNFIERDQMIDIAVDEEVSRMVRNASYGHPAIAEAQIGAATATQALRESNAEGRAIEAPVIRILLWATADVRIHRMYLAARAKGENISLNEIRERTRMRELGDRKHWKDVHSYLGDGDPLEMGARDAYGEKIYYIEINNTHYSADQTYNDVLSSLRNMRMIVKNPLPTQQIRSAELD